MMLKRILTLIGLLMSVSSYSQTLRYDTIVPLNDNVAIGDISDVIEAGSGYVLRFQRNKALTEKVTQPKSSIPTAYISYVVWDGVRIDGKNLKPTVQQTSNVSKSTRGNLLLDNGNKKIKAGGILTVIGGAFLTTGLIMATQPIDPKVSTSLMIIGGVNITFGGGFIASGVSRNDKIRRIKTRN